MIFRIASVWIQMMAHLSLRVPGAASIPRSKSSRTSTLPPAVLRTEDGQEVGGPKKQLRQTCCSLWSTCGSNKIAWILGWSQCLGNRQCRYHGFFRNNVNRYHLPTKRGRAVPTTSLLAAFQIRYTKNGPRRLGNPMPLCVQKMDQLCL